MLNESLFEFVYLKNLFRTFCLAFHFLIQYTNWMMNWMSVRIREAIFFFFLAFTRLLFSLSVRAFYYPWTWWRGISFSCLWLLLFILLTCSGSFGFSDTLFTGLSYELSPALSISWPASSLKLTKGEITFALLDLTTVEIALASCWSVCRDSASLKLYDIIYCIKYIFLDNISSSLPVVGARMLPFANKVEKGLRIGLHDG